MLLDVFERAERRVGARSVQRKRCSASRRTHLHVLGEQCGKLGEVGVSVTAPGGTRGVSQSVRHRGSARGHSGGHYREFGERGERGERVPDER